MAVVTIAALSNVTPADGQQPTTTVPNEPAEVPCAPAILCAGGSTEPTHPSIAAGVVKFVPGEDVYRIPTSSSFLAGCTFEFTEAGETPIGETSALTGLVDGVWPVDYWLIFCDDTAFAYTFYPDGDPPPPAVIDDMIADAYSRTPVSAFNPITSPDGDEAIALVVHTPTYLWVDDVTWTTPVSATATIPGFSVTTTATADLASWSGGDEPVDCTGDDMIPYESGRGEDNQRSECIMVYKRSSAIADWTVDLSVTWDVSYSCSVPVCGGPLPPIVTNSTRPVIVKEILAVAS